MKKLESDIQRAAKKYERAKAEYEKARDALQSLVELKEVERLDEQGIKPNLVNVMQYSAYLSGVQRAVEKILNDHFKMYNADQLSSKDSRLLFVAEVEIALKDKISADRWIGNYPNMSVKAVEFDKKGKATKYKANWYVERIVKQEI